nr:hypothetical protein Iba_chr14cCG3430 [Ipomoea batatas]
MDYGGAASERLWISLSSSMDSDGAARDSPPPSGFHQQTAAWLRQSPPPATAQHSRSRSNAAALRPPQQAATSPPSAQHQPAALRPPISSPVVVGRSTIKSRDLDFAPFLQHAVIPSIDMYYGKGTHEVPILGTKIEYVLITCT